ncbi:hypothetical protein CVV38_02940 [Candidatus Peregrinibacteria bacterium HGW-Peregrinibacteria-1]|jgi:DNA-binding PadR family transcriptional regulator|nr:MAG: hypothetical protein CVV38_02940 [Candidatus Peregrinibacteria bacterium HGW-Peregrinibacteria-1]
MKTETNVEVLNTIGELGGIINNLLLLLSDKEKDVIQKRFNLNGYGKHTLESIGQEFQVTRERVRQIEKNALSKMKRNVFNTELKHLHQHANDLLKKNGGLMREQYLIDEFVSLASADRKSVKSGLHLALVLNEEFSCTRNTVNFYPHVKNKNLPHQAIKLVSGQVINKLNQYGDVKPLSKVHNDLEPKLKEVGFDSRQLESLIGIDKRLTLVNKDMVGLMSWRHVNPKTLRDKILYVLRNNKKPMYFRNIAKKIEEYGFNARKVNIQAVHNELIRNESFVLIGRGIYALDEWGYESGTVLDVVEKLLKENGEMMVDDIVKEVLSQRQVKKITIMLALKSSERIERIGRNAYKLI